jgi:hypothetical protein
LWGGRLHSWTNRTVRVRASASFATFLHPNPLAICIRTLRSGTSGVVRYRKLCTETGMSGRVAPGDLGCNGLLLGRIGSLFLQLSSLVTPNLGSQFEDPSRRRADPFCKSITKIPSNPESRDGGRCRTSSDCVKLKTANEADSGLYRAGRPRLR